MALAIHPSSPPRATAAATSVTTAEFTPPAGSVLLVSTSATGGTQANPTITVSAPTGAANLSAFTEASRATRTTTGATTASDGSAGGR